MSRGGWSCLPLAVVGRDAREVQDNMFFELPLISFMPLRHWNQRREACSSESHATWKPWGPVHTCINVATIRFTQGIVRKELCWAGQTILS